MSDPSGTLDTPNNERNVIPVGDRRNIVVDNDNGTSVALYTHWRGSSTREVLARALDKGRSRWDDIPYLTRIIFDGLVNGDDETTGFGIQAFATGSNAYCEASPGYDLFVDTINKTVTGDDKGEGTVLTFDEFIRLNAIVAV